MHYDLNTRFSQATLEHACLSFGDALKEFENANQHFKDYMGATFNEKHLFLAAIDSCLASRTVWLRAFPEWRRRTDMRNELKDLMAALKQSRSLLTEFSAVLRKSGDLEKNALKLEKLSRFLQNVERREEMVAVLLDEKESREARESKIIALEGGGQSALLQKQL